MPLGQIATMFNNKNRKIPGARSYPLGISSLDGNIRMEQAAGQPPPRLPGALDMLPSIGRTKKLPQGVSDTTSGKYQARIKMNGKRRDLGTFATVEEAAVAYAVAKRTGSPAARRSRAQPGLARRAEQARPTCPAPAP